MKKMFLGVLNYVSLDYVQTNIGIHKNDIDVNRYGNLNCKILKLNFNNLLIESNTVDFIPYDVSMKIDFGNQTCWIGHDYSTTNDEYLAVSLEDSDVVWSINKKKLLNSLDNCQ